MIDWLLSAQPHALRASRWIVLCCCLALLSLASLPHNAADRIIAIVGVTVIFVVFALWLGMVALAILKPRLFDDLRRKRSNAAPEATLDGPG